MARCSETMAGRRDGSPSPRKRRGELRGPGRAWAEEDKELAPTRSG